MTDDFLCAELSKSESLVETLKAGATDLRAAMGRAIASFQTGAAITPDERLEAENDLRNTLRAYSQRLADWDRKQCAS